MCRYFISLIVSKVIGVDLNMLIYRKICFIFSSTTMGQ